MNRWEYKCLRFGVRELAEGWEEKLNALGAEGWEVVAAVSGERHGYARRDVRDEATMPLSGRRSRGRSVARPLHRPLV